MKYILPKFVLSILLVHFLMPIRADLDEVARKKSKLAFQSEHWIEGYNRAISGEWIQYNSVRGDINRALLTRTTTGDKTIIWETAPVPPGQEEETVTFLWMAGMDMNRGPYEFTLYINDVPRFIFSNGPGADWSVAGISGGTMSFATIKHDQHGDGFGYMWMAVPRNWCEAGKSLEIKVVGSARNSTAWYMTFEAPDALAFLQNEAEYEGWITLVPWEQGGLVSIDIEASPNWSERVLFLKTDGRVLGSCTLVTQDGRASGSLPLNIPTSGIDMPLQLFLDDRFIGTLPRLFESFSETQLYNKSVVLLEAGNGREKEKWAIRISLFYRPNLIGKLQAVSRSPAAGATFYLMNSSHQDIAWMDSPEKCIIERDTMLLTPLIDRALQDPSYRFDVEDVLMLMEYLERHPDRKSSIHELLLDGKISVGASYTMPYEDMYSGESLIRQFYLGKRWIENEFPGYIADTYWNVDVPGKTLQMPQILKKSGVPNMVLSRQKKGLYNWFSPDGSHVTTFSPGHYSLAYPALNRDFFDAAFFLADHALQWDHVRNTKGMVAIPVLSDWDMSPAKDYSALIREWEAIDAFYNENGEKGQLQLPEFRLSLVNDFFQDLDALELPDPIRGERPNVWLYIHGPSHHKALKASREADRLLPLAEIFATCESLMDGHFKQYPEPELNAAWRQKIYPDHGWGGKHGDITDALFRSKFEKSLTASQNLLSRSLQNIASRVNVSEKMGTPFMVFNGLSWVRTDPVVASFRFEPGEARSLVIRNGSGDILEHQVRHATYFPDGSIKTADLEFMADGIPSLGYKTFYLAPSWEPVQEDLSRRPDPAKIENRFYTIETGPGGLKQIYDKELGVAILRDTHYNAGEVITMTSVGNGAGEFADVQQPDPSDMEQTGQYDTNWSVDDDGPIHTRISYEQKLKHAVVHQTIRIYKHIKRIDFETSLMNWDGTLFREFRETFPVNMDEPVVSYEVPFGVVTVGEDEIQEAAGERYTTHCADVHPRSILNWISASDRRFGVTLSSSVVAWDYLDLKNPAGPGNILQPILLASRKSCHGEGNDYLQTGTHHFRFSLSSHQPGWSNGYKHGLQSNHPLMVVVDPPQYLDASLPESMSFFEVDNEDIIISTIKKAESDEGFVIRLYETKGVERRTKVKAWFPMRKVAQTNLIEETERPIPHEKYSFEITPSGHGIETYKIIPSYDE